MHKKGFKNFTVFDKEVDIWKLRKIGNFEAMCKSWIKIVVGKYEVLGTGWMQVLIRKKRN